MSFLSSLLVGQSPSTQVVNPGYTSSLDPTQASLEQALMMLQSPSTAFPSYSGPLTSPLSPLQSSSLADLSQLLPGATAAGQAGTTGAVTGTNELANVATNATSNLENTFQSGVVAPLMQNLEQNILPGITSSLGASEGGAHSTAANQAIQQALQNFNTTATAAGANLTATGQQQQIQAAGALPGAAQTDTSLLGGLLQAGAVPTALNLQNISNLFQGYNQGNQNTQTSMADILQLLGTKTQQQNAVVEQPGSTGLLQGLLGNAGLGNQFGSWLFS